MIDIELAIAVAIDHALALDIDIAIDLALDIDIDIAIDLVFPTCVKVRTLLHLKSLPS